MNKIIKSENDTRDYEWFELENKLKVIMIKDNLSKICGALLNVNIGSVHDTYPGMAHFLEHMVFMGSEKYPNESNFMDSVAKNGGITNAMTGDTHTSYYFSISSNQYLNILDMFSWFFINPLLRKDCIDREVNAVDSESKKNLLDDKWIFQEIIKKSMVNDHPINHFTCGNKDTLKDDDLDDNTLYNKVKIFFDKYYSSNIMHLILFINDEINKDQLIMQINNTFGQIKNKNVNLDTNFGQIINPGNIIKYIPNKDMNVLNICMEIPNYSKNYVDSPLHLLNWILSNKTEFSLFKIYENLGFILETKFEEMFYYDDYTLFIYKIVLNENGNSDKNILKIIEIFFDYIKSIICSNKLKNIYDNMLMNDHRNYYIPHHNDITDSLLEFNLLLIKNIKPENLLNYDLVKLKYDKLESLIQKTFKSIKLHNSFIVYSSHKLKLKNPEIDEIYNVKYIVDKLEPIKLNINKYEIININKFITDKVNIIKGNDMYINKNPEIINNKIYTMCYNFNSSFNTPSVNVYLLLEFPDLIKDPEIYMKSLLYLDTIYSDNSNIISELDNANYTIKLILDLNLLLIYIGGDNEKIFDLIDIFGNIYSLNNKGSGFNSTKEKLFKTYTGFNNEQPYKKISKLISKYLLNVYYTPYDLLKHIDQTFEDCKDTFNKINKNAKTSIFISGNIDKEKSIKIADKLYSKLNIENEINTECEMIFKDLKLPFVIKYRNKNKEETNTIFTIIYEISRIKKGEKDWEKYTAFGILLEAITNNKYFNSLRTRDQLGYIVNTKLVYIGRNNNKICGLRFLIQSPLKKSEFLLKKTKHFVKNELYKYIRNFKESDLDEYKYGEISILKQKYNNLEEMDLFLCVQIFDGSFQFDYNEKIIDAIKLFNVKNFTEMYEKIILKSNKFYSISIDSTNL